MKISTNKKSLTALTVALGFLAVVGTAQASQFDLYFSNSGTFAGTAPSTPSNPNEVWATANFNDGGGTGTVLLTMNVLNNLSSGAYVNDWYFNVSSSLSGMTHSSGIMASSVDFGPGNHFADGGGNYDFEIHFNTSSPGNLGQGLQSVYTLTGTGITASSFNLLSDSHGGNGIHLGAVHVQGYESNSAWVAGAVPEPETYAMFMAGLGLMGFIARRRKNGQA